MTLINKLLPQVITSKHKIIHKSIHPHLDYLYRPEVQCNNRYWEIKEQPRVIKKKRKRLLFHPYLVDLAVRNTT